MIGEQAYFFKIDVNNMIYLEYMYPQQLLAMYTISPSHPSNIQHVIPYNCCSKNNDVKCVPALTGSNHGLRYVRDYCNASAVMIQ